MELLFVIIIAASMMMLKKSFQGMAGKEDDNDELFHLDSADDD